MLSIIIPTYNRAKLLLRTLAAIAKVDFPASAFEVIVVDNCSTDATPESCEEFKHRKLIKNFRYERCARPGLHVGRHRGAKVAAADILVYGDDDIVPESTWLSAIQEAFLDPAVVLVGGNNLPDYESTPPDWGRFLWKENEWGWYNGYYSLIDFGAEKKTIPADYVYGCNFSIRKSALLAAGGFHPDGMPRELLRYRGDGESSVSRKLNRMGAKTIFHPGASIRHWVPASRMTPDYLRFRGYIQGISDSYTRVRETQTVDPARNAVWQLLRQAKTRAARFATRNQPSAWSGRGSQEGYRFHQEETKRDPKLLQWVLQKDYWDEPSSPPNHE